MADINARLLQAIDGSAPQHKVRGQNRFEFSEGSDRTLHVKIAGKNGNPLDFEGDKFPVEDKQLQSVINELNKVKSELESIKNGTLKVKNDQLIDKIDALLAKQQSLEDKINSVIQGNAFRTQLTGSLTEYKEILLANSIAIRDTNYHHYDGGNWDAQTAQQAKPIDNFNKYKYRSFLVINSLDQPLGLELLHNLRAPNTYDNLLYGPNAEPQTVTLPNKGQYSPYAIDANIIPSLDGILGGNVTVRVRAKVAPTTGSFKLSIVMWN